MTEDNQKMIAKLVRQAKKGESEAYQKLYNLTSKSVFYLIFKKVQNQEEAKDLLQEVYLQAFKQLHTLKDDQLFIAWLHKIANYQYIDYSRSKKNLLSDALSFDEEIDVPSLKTEFLPEAAYEIREQRELILKSINELPEMQRTSLFMFYYDGMSTEEIAQTLNTTSNTICKRLSDARKNIKVKLEKLVGEGISLYGMSITHVLTKIFKSDITTTVSDEALSQAWQNMATDVLKISNTAARLHTYALVAKGAAAVFVGGIVTFFATFPEVEQPTQMAQTEFLQTAPTNAPSQSPTPLQIVEATKPPTFTNEPTQIEQQQAPTQIEQQTPPPPKQETPEQTIEPPPDAFVQAQPPKPTESELLPTQTPLSAPQIATPQQRENVTATQPPQEQPNKTQTATPQPTPKMTIGEIVIYREIGDPITLETFLQSVRESTPTIFNNIDGACENFPTLETLNTIGAHKLSVTFGDMDANVLLIAEDTTPPQINITNDTLTYSISDNADTPLTLERILADANMTVTDNQPDQIEPTITGTEQIQSTTKGVFVLKIKATDARGNLAAHRVIIVTIVE